MNPLGAWRQELRGLIPRGFLKMDRGAGLFVSDYPRGGGEAEITAALRAAGFCVTVQNQIARIDGTREKYAALLGTFHAAAPLPTDETLFLYALAQRLIRARTPIREQPVHLLGWTMKCLEMDAWEELRQRLPAQIALCQRERVPLPSAAGELIWNALTERMKGAEDGC